MPTLSANDYLLLIGQQQVEIILLRQQVAALTEHARQVNEQRSGGSAPTSEQGGE